MFLQHKNTITAIAAVGPKISSMINHSPKAAMSSQILKLTDVFVIFFTEFKIELFIFPFSMISVEFTLLKKSDFSE